MSFILLGILNSQAAGAVGEGAYDLLETEILASDAASVTFDNLDTIAADYKHLQIRHSLQVSQAGEGTVFMTFNGDTANNYASHRLIGNGSNVSSDSFTSRANLFAGSISGTGASSSAFAGGVVDILDFSSTSKNTTVRTLSGVTAVANFVILFSGLYNSTSAVTSITMTPNEQSFTAKSRFSLYGIRG